MKLILTTFWLALSVMFFALGNPIYGIICIIAAAFIAGTDI